MPTIVSVTVVAGSGGSSVTADPDPVVIPAGVRGPIQWRITNSAADGWKFQMNGIDIAGAGTEFDQPSGGGQRVFTWNNNHTKPGQFKYTIRVSNDTTTVENDPSIMNR